MGNLLSGSVGVLNFLLMGITVQNSMEKEEKDARQAMKASCALRTLLLFIAAMIGVLLPCFSTWTVLIPLFFPRVAIALRPVWDKSLRATEAQVGMGAESEKKEDANDEG